MKTDIFKNVILLVAVAEHKSLTLAAEQLGCSKAHLSQQIKKLEQQYKIQLFHRTTRQLKLTTIGESFLLECKQAIKLVEQAELHLMDTQNTLSGTINVTSVGGIFGEKYIAPAVISFMKQHPDIKINLDFSSHHQDLISSPYDLAIRMGPLEDSSLVAKRLCTYKPTLVASPQYLKHYGTPKHPKDLSNHRTISGSITRWQFLREVKSSTRSSEKYEHVVSSILSSSNGHVMLSACEAGLGIARLPSMYVDKSLETGKLVSILTRWNQTQHPCSVVYPPGQFRLNRVKAFTDWLTEHVPQS